MADRFFRGEKFDREKEIDFLVDWFNGLPEKHSGSMVKLIRKTTLLNSFMPLL